MTAAELDVQPEHRAIVEHLLRRYVPHQAVWAFCSRIMGTARRFSDLDLSVITDTPLDLGLRAELLEAFSESDLPYRVDLVDWASTSDTFRDIIRAHHVVIQTADENDRATP